MIYIFLFYVKILNILQKDGDTLKTIDYQDLNFIDDEQCGFGSYGKIKRCTFDGKNYVLKVFDNSNYLNGKRRKLSLLSKVDVQGLYVPELWVKKNNHTNMYLSEFYDGKDVIFLDQEHHNVRIKYLKDIKKEILLMHEHGIIHADLISSNIMYSNGTVAIIDFDNCSYKKYRTDTRYVNDYSMDFIETYGIVPELDIFMFNLLTYLIINEESDYYMVRNNIWLKKYGKFNNKDGIKICNSMLLGDKNPNKDFLIDIIDETSVTL